MYIDYIDALIPYLSRPSAAQAGQRKSSQSWTSPVSNMYPASSPKQSLGTYEERMCTWKNQAESQSDLLQQRQYVGLCVLTWARAWLSARTGVVGSVWMLCMCACLCAFCLFCLCLPGRVWLCVSSVCVCVSHDPSTSKKVALHCTMHLAGPLVSTNQEWWYLDSQVGSGQNLCICCIWASYVIPHPALPVTPPSSNDSTVTNWASKATCWKIDIQ